MKVLEHIVNTIIREQVSINNMKFGFMPSRDTTDAIFMLRQLQEKYLQKNKNIYFAFVDLELALDCVPRGILWWEMQKFRIDKWIIQIVKSMYDNAHSKVRITTSYSNPIKVSVGVHQGYKLSSPLFIIVTEALLLLLLSREFRTGCPWELLYTDDLAIVAESFGELKIRLKNWNDGLEEKGLKVNVGKTKFLFSRYDVSKSKIASVNFPCSVCMKGVGDNSILYLSCRNWVHKRCSGIKPSLRNCEDFICKTCSTITGAVDLFPTYITIDRDEFEIVIEFRYLGDVIGQAGGCSDAVTACIGSGWIKRLFTNFCQYSQTKVYLL